MRVMMLDWQQAAWLAAGLAASGWAARLVPRRALPADHVAARRLRAVAPFAIEGALVAALYSLWQLAGDLSRFGTGPAFARAHWILRAEHDIGLPSERDLQPLVDHAVIAHVVDLYYDTMHFTVMGIFLVWLFLRHRDHYRGVRRVLTVATLTCLVIQFWPVAPPRLLPGFVDIALKYHQSVYGNAFGADQLSAMPSVHVCWAVLVGVAVWRISPSRWRVIGPLHTVITVFVVVATANHYWADGIVAVAVLGLSVLACQGAQRVLDRLAERVGERTDPGAIPARELSNAPGGVILPVMTISTQDQD